VFLARSPFGSGGLQTVRLWLSLKPGRGKRSGGGSSTVRFVEGSPAQNGATEKLRHWESGSRDGVVHGAAAVGLGLARIQRITGLGTTTIMRILNNRPDRARSPS
jgi:hypothetical protein